MLRILGRRNSINVRKVLWLADELAIPHRREDWGRGYRPTCDPVFRKLSPNGTVPVIEDDGFVLRESHAILRYLAGKHGPDTIYPCDPRRRALVDQWLDWAATDVERHLLPLYLGGHMRLEPYRVPGLLAAARDGIHAEMVVLDGELARRGPYLVGAELTLADIAAGLVVNRFLMLRLMRAELPALLAYYRRLSRRPAFLAHGRNGLP